jgi:antitoxin component of MazEF toxin-antitoxin module
MINVAKRLGIWGEPLKLRRKLSRSGRGTVLRIPIDIEQALRLKGNEEVLVSKAGRKIIVEVQD